MVQTQLCIQTGELCIIVRLSNDFESWPFLFIVGIRTGICGIIILSHGNSLDYDSTFDLQIKNTLLPNVGAVKNSLTASFVEFYSSKHC